MVPSSQRYYITIKADSRAVAVTAVPPFPIFFSLRSLCLSLRVIHHPFFLFFTRTPLSSNLFLMSDLARQNVKPRLFRFSQRYFASTPMLMFFLLRSKGSLFSPSPSSLKSMFLQRGLRSFYSICLLWLSYFSPGCGFRLPWLSPINDLVIWTDGLIPFALGNNGSETTN